MIVRLVILKTKITLENACEGNIKDIKTQGNFGISLNVHLHLIKQVTGNLPSLHFKL